MSYQLIVLGASAGGKSTLMRYLREHTNLRVIEMDEEIIKTTDGKWPTDDNYRNTVLIPQITSKILEKDGVVYLSSYVPEEYVKKAKRKGFILILLDVSREELVVRDKKRIAEEKYESVARYFDMQLEGFEKLKKEKLIDEIIDAHKSTATISAKIQELAGGFSR